MRRHRFWFNFLFLNIEFTRTGSLFYNRIYEIIDFRQCIYSLRFFRNFEVKNNSLKNSKLKKKVRAKSYVSVSVSVNHDGRSLNRVVSLSVLMQDVIAFHRMCSNRNATQLPERCFLFAAFTFTISSHFCTQYIAVVRERFTNILSKLNNTTQILNSNEMFIINKIINIY